MARGARFDAFKAELGDLGRAVLDRTEDAFDGMTERIGDRLDGAGERIEGAGDRLVARRQDRLSERQDRIEDGGLIEGTRERLDRAGDAIGEALDPVRNVARAGINALGDVTEAVTRGAVTFESVEGEGFSAEASLLGREVGVNLDLDRSDGTLGVGASADTALLGFDAGVERSVDEDTGAVRREASVGGRVLDTEGDVGVSVSTGQTAGGQRGVDLAAFAEAIVDDELVTKEAGVTVNRDSSAGQAGIDLGVFGQSSRDGETTDRTELIGTINQDTSDDQTGRDRGVAREEFTGGEEAARTEFVRTVNIGTSDGQLEVDLGVGRESIIDGVEERTEKGVFLDVGGDDQLIERQRGFFSETEVDGVEVARSELVTSEERFGVDDGRLVQGSAGTPDLPKFGREIFEDGEETFSSRLGAEFSRGFNEKGHADFGLDFVREVSVDGEQVIDDREQGFGVSTDLADEENRENIELLLKGKDREIVEKIVEKGADFFAGDDESLARTGAALSPRAARALLATEADDEDDFGAGAAVVEEAAPAPSAAPVAPVVGTVDELRASGETASVAGPEPIVEPLPESVVEPVPDDTSDAPVDE